MQKSLIFGLQLKFKPGLKVIKLFFMLNSTDHDIFSVHKWSNVNNCWHFNIY